jgi:CTP synthase
LSFIEAIRELSVRVGRENCAFVHVVYLPYLGASKELKTKPAQNAVRELRGLGIVPDVLVARSESEADENVITKLSQFAGVPEESIILLPNAKSIYQVPLTIEERGIGDVLTNHLGIGKSKSNLKDWRSLVDTAVNADLPTLKVGVVAKYLNNQDTYMSVFEALASAGWDNNYQVDISWIDAENITDSNVAEQLSGVDGIVVPGGFGERGVDGMITAAQYAMNSKLPYLGICLGLQVAVIAAARKAGLQGAHTTEINSDSADPVISTMEGQQGKEATGGTMRLGNYESVLAQGSLAHQVYGSKTATERHRHRYECNNSYRDSYESWGIRVSATSPDGNLVEMVEAIDHPFFLAAQSHPEFNSRPNRPYPFFNGFVKSLINAQK